MDSPSGYSLPNSDNGNATAVAAVLSNWHNVLRAINMASSTHTWSIHFSYSRIDLRLVKVPRPSIAEDKEKPRDDPETPLPQTLVRIPVEPQSEVSQSQNGTGNSNEG